MAIDTLDEIEQAIIHMYRDALEFGFGRVEVVVVKGDLDKLYSNKSYTKEDLKAYLLDKSQVTD